MTLLARDRAILALVASGLGAACDGRANAPVDASVVDVLLVCADGCAPFACDGERGHCFGSCSGAEQCAAGFACVDRSCVGTECTVATAAATCGAYACVNGTCATDCAIGPCADGFYCRADVNTCVPRCTRAGDPVCEGFRCDVVVGECESYCLDGELGCAAGYTCASGSQCQPDLAAPPCASGCGAYTCVATFDRCATHCADDADCAAPAACVARQCI